MPCYPTVLHLILILPPLRQGCRTLNRQSIITSVPPVATADCVRAYSIPARSSSVDQIFSKLSTSPKQDPGPKTVAPPGPPPCAAERVNSTRLHAGDAAHKTIGMMRAAVKRPP